MHNPKEEEKTAIFLPVGLAIKDVEQTRWVT